MSEVSNEFEFLGSTVEDAIESGLQELGLSTDQVEIEVLDEGKKNLFKFSSRLARVRLHKIDAGSKNENTLTAIENSDENPRMVHDSSFGHDEEEKAKIREILDQIIKLMGFKVNVESILDQGSKNHIQPLKFNIEGKDLSVLIGRKSETINAIQYITSLIAGNKLNRWVPIQVDVQKYRERREQELAKLAKRMADQVITTGRKQYLEPMPANERRIIHMTLREVKDIETKSIGEEPNRKVVISLKM